MPRWRPPSRASGRARRLPPGPIREPDTWPDQHFGTPRSGPSPPVLYGAETPPLPFGNPVDGAIGQDKPAPSGFRLTRPYGDGTLPQYGNHDGIDVGNGKSGDPILAMEDGSVYQAFYDSASGGAGIIRIDHGGGWTTGYAHMDRLYVKVGATVTRGQTIARLDNTGWSTGAHLHMDTSYKAQRRDPWPLLEQNVPTILPGYMDRIDNRRTTTAAPTNFRELPSTSAAIVGQLPAGSAIVPIATCRGTKVGTAPDATVWYANVKTQGLPGDQAFLGYVHSSTLTRTKDGAGVALVAIETSGSTPAQVDAAEKAAADAVRDKGVAALNAAAKVYGA